MNYELKRAVVTSGRNVEIGNLFQVRVMPEMSEIQESNLLPYYPNFFAKDNIAYIPNDEVWVMCSPDFKVGFVIGLCQPPAGEDLTSFIQLVNSAEITAGFELSGVDELYIGRVSGTSFTFENINNGQSGTIYQNKLVILTSQYGDIWIQNPVAKISVSKRGDISIAGKSKKEKYSGEVSTTSSSITEITGSKRTEAAGNILNSASGTLQNVTSSDRFDHSAGDAEELVAKKKKETYGLGKETTIVGGNNSDLILAGNYEITVAAGQVKITAGLGASITSAGPIAITSLTNIKISATTITVPPGVVAPGLGPFNCLPICPIIGIPHSGNVSVGVPI